MVTQVMAVRVRVISATVMVIWPGPLVVLPPQAAAVGIIKTAGDGGKRLKRQ